MCCRRFIVREVIISWLRLKSAFCHPVLEESDRTSSPAAQYVDNCLDRLTTSKWEKTCFARRRNFTKKTLKGGTSISKMEFLYREDIFGRDFTPVCRKGKPFQASLAALARQLRVNVWLVATIQLDVLQLLLRQVRTRRSRYQMSWRATHLKVVFVIRKNVQDVLERENRAAK